MKANQNQNVLATQCTELRECESETNNDNLCNRFFFSARSKSCLCNLPRVNTGNLYGQTFEPLLTQQVQSRVCPDSRRNHLPCGFFLTISCASLPVTVVCVKVPMMCCEITAPAPLNASTFSHPVLWLCRNLPGISVLTSNHSFLIG